MTERSTYGLRLDQLAGLLATGVETPINRPEGQQKMAEMLREHVTSALPTGLLLLDALVMMMGRRGHDTRSLVGKSLMEVVLNPQSDIGLLETIKDCSKKLSCMLDSKTEAAIATAIYYAVLASALVYHDKRMTRYSYDALDQSFALLMGKKWMAPELAELFDRARRVCQGKRGEE
jgi:hypothetical protein